MQFENILEPIDTRTYLFTLYKTLTDNKWYSQHLCVYNHSKHRYEEITPCLTNDTLEKLKDDIFNLLNLQETNQEIS